MIEDPTTLTTPKKNRPIIPFLIAFVILGGFLAYLFFGLQRTYQGPVVVGDQIKPFTLTTFDGESYNTKDLNGKVLVINFWASWCKPCESESAFLQEAWEYYRPDEKVVFLGVDYVDTEPEARASLAKFGIDFPNGPDLGTKISQAFRIRGVPETYIVDKQGKLTYIQIGPFSSVDQIKDLVDPLID